MTAGPLARRPGPTVRVRVTEERPAADGADGGRRREDRVITEEPLEIRLAWPGRPAERAWVTMRTPGNDFELAAGWAVHEGLGAAEAVGGGVAGVAYCTDRRLDRREEFNVVTLTLTDAPARTPREQLTTVVTGSSACGVCGTDSIDEVLRDVARPWDGPLPSPAVVRDLPDRLRARQQLFDRTGGVHAAGLATADGELLAVREDVGRHNAVDKVTGARVLSGEDPAAACLVVSGRAGFELVQKALAAGVGSLVSVGAPTSLAVELAERGGLALWGWARPDRAVRYC